MEEVDWSKAPDGATHYNAKCRWPWLRCAPASYFCDGGWVEYKSNDHFWECHFSGAVKRPQEWDGKGLPPVGTVCEYRVNKDEWVSGEVFGHRVCSNGDVEVFVSLKNSWDYSSAPDRFRPIKTPEQIAAEERLHAIDEMVYLSQRGGSTYKDVMRALYDAGYRKVEV